MTTKLFQIAAFCFVLSASSYAQTITTAGVAWKGTNGANVFSINPTGSVTSPFFIGDGSQLTGIVGGSGTFDYATLTNKPAPILLLATNQGSSLSNAFAIAAGDSSVTLVTNANGRLVTITSTGGTNGGGGAAVVSNSVVVWSAGAWFTNSTAYYLVVNAPVILTTDNTGGNSGQMNFNVDTNLNGATDWFLRSSIAVDSATTVLSTDIRYLGGIVPPNSAFQYEDVSINGTATLDGVMELTFLSTGSGSGTGIATNGGTGINNRFTNTVFAGTIGFSNDVTIAGNIAVAGTFTVPTLAVTNVSTVWTNALIATDANGYMTNAGPPPTMPYLRTANELFTEFLAAPGTASSANDLGLITIANSGTAASQIAGETNAPGIVQLSTSTSASSAPIITSLFGGNNYLLNGGSYTNEWRVRFPTLPTAAESYTNRIGFSSSTTSAEAANGAYFRISTNETHFECVCISASATTKGTNTTTIVANTWYKLRVAVVPGGTAYFTVNDADALTVTGAPTTVATSIAAQIVKNAGTTARTLDADYCWLGYKLVTTR